MEARHVENQKEFSRKGTVHRYSSLTIASGYGGGGRGLEIDHKRGFHERTTYVTSVSGQAFSTTWPDMAHWRNL